MMKPKGTPKPNPAKNSTICFSLLISMHLAAGPNHEVRRLALLACYPPPTIGYTKFS